MKKSVFLLLATIIFPIQTAALADEYYNPYEFTDKLSDCAVYQMSDETGIKNILGWRAGQCVYEERLLYGDTTRCYFSDSQVREIAEAMRNHGYSNKEITLKYTNGDEETFDYGFASVKFWAKYLNMPGACSKQ